MKKKSTKIIAIIAGIIIILALSVYFAVFAGVKVNKVSEGVYETKAFTSTNSKFNDWFLKYIFSGNPGGCSAVAKTLENGDTIVGRNMDFYVSNKPAFIVRTKEKGKYETVGIAYYDQFIPDTDVVEKRGVARVIYSMLPMFCQDVMNDQGLYVEVNMRYSEYDPMGELMFADTHTNPKSEVRKCIAGINNQLCQNCATVKEAVEYIKSLDIYSPQSEEMQWNFCYILADATGDYGLLEVANDKVSFLDKQQMQTNFYVTEEFYEKQRMKCGVGRYDLLKAGIDDVNSEEDMFKIIDSVSYAQSYDYKTCNYDARSEYIGEQPGWDYYYVIDEKNQDEVNKYLDEVANTYNSMSRQELKDDGTYWESSYTTIANCNEKTMRVRFYEDDSNVINIGFEK